MALPTSPRGSAPLSPRQQRRPPLPPGSPGGGSAPPPAAPAAGFKLTSTAPVARGPDIWTLDGRLEGSWGVSSFPVRMTIVRSGGGQGDAPLLLVSSFPPDARVLELLRPLGQVRLVLAPNAAHCLWGAAMRDACPGVLLAGPPNAAARHPDICWDALVKTPTDFRTLLMRQGFSAADLRAWTTCKASPWLQEVPLLHKPSRTLILTDLAFNFKLSGGETPLPGGPLGFLMRTLYLPLVGGYRPCCVTKPFGLSFLLPDADAMCTVMQEIVATDFDQVIMAHGDVVCSPGGKAAFQQGSVAFFQEVAERRRQQQEAGGAGPSRATLLVAAGAVSAAAAAVAVLRWRASR
ncbi:hypothetical protein ABPG75_003125 [Micractinium tetrahymenae]